MKNSILDIINKIGKEEKREKYVLIYLRRGQTNVCIKTDNLRQYYSLSRQVSKDGFYKITLKNQKIKNFSKVKEDQEFEIVSYLESLPSIDYIISRPLSDKEWLAVPFDPNRATSKNLIGSQIIVECNDINYFDHVVCSLTEEGQLIYKDINCNFDPSASESIRNQFQDCLEKEKYIKFDDIDVPKLSSFKTYQEAWNLATEEVLAKKTKTIEKLKLNTRDYINHLFAKTDAKLKNVLIRKDLVEVQWESSRGGSYNSIARIKDLSIVSAGICLSNQDKKFDLVSLIGIVNQGEKRNLIYRTRDFDNGDEIAEEFYDMGNEDDDHDY